jgi:hypothetical protein
MLFLLILLSLCQVRSKLFGEGGKFIIVYGSSLFTCLEILKSLHLILWQILPVLLAKCTKFIIIKNIFSPLRLFLFDGTLPSEFDPASNYRPTSLLSNHRKRFSDPRHDSLLIRLLACLGLMAALVQLLSSFSSGRRLAVATSNT